MDNPLTKISQFAADFFKQEKSESALGVDIGSSSIKVVQLKKKGGRAVLETYGALSLGPYAGLVIGQLTNLPVEALSQALTDIIKEANVTTKIGAIAIPSSASLISLINLPNGIGEKEFPEVVQNEARKYIPVPISEVTLDWWMIPQQVESFEDTATSSSITPEVKNEVLVVAIHNDTLSKYREILSKTGLTSDFFEIEIFSSIRATLSHDLTPVLIMDFGASKTKLSIVEYGITRGFHIINRGSHDITLNISQSLSISFAEAEKLKREVGIDASVNPTVAEIVRLSVEYIMTETNTVVLNYEKKYNKNISKVILSGGGSLTRGLLERAQESFQAEVVYGDSFGKIEAPAFLAPILTASGPEFAVAVGLALRELS